ncbi:MAG: hypothetical protein GY714_21465 [Desulfobacterales bacterium]|nr:hypothetical protein [Desulfobacterales bacterium]MCP4163357.1 hypothetical protein [Deltaproteobacteria bacterium]
MKIFLIIFGLLVITGCDVFIQYCDVGKSYYVDSEYRGLNYALDDGGGIGRIKSGVTAAGWNNKHLIIERRRDDNLYFYIIDVEKDHGFAENQEFVSGPFSEKKFLEQRKRMGVDPKLQFTKRWSNCCWIE